MLLDFRSSHVVGRSWWYRVGEEETSVDNVRRCNTSSVGQRAEPLVPRSSVRFRQNPKKTENSNLHGFELHRPSNKGIELLFQVINAFLNQSMNLSISPTWAKLTDSSTLKLQWLVGICDCKAALRVQKNRAVRYCVALNCGARSTVRAQKGGRRNIRRRSSLLASRILRFNDEEHLQLLFLLSSQQVWVPAVTHSALHIEDLQPFVLCCLSLFPTIWNFMVARIEWIWA